MKLELKSGSKVKSIHHSFGGQVDMSSFPKSMSGDSQLPVTSTLEDLTLVTSAGAYTHFHMSTHRNMRKTQYNKNTFNMMRSLTLKKTYIYTTKMFLLLGNMQTIFKIF